MPLRGLKVAEHNHQEIVEVVRDAAAELADRLHFLCGGKLLLYLLQQALCLHPFGDIARDLGKAYELTTLIADWIYYDECAKSASVLSHAEAFGFESAVAHRAFQRPCRHTSVAVFLGVE